MNRTLIILAFVGLAAVGLAGGIIVHWLNPEAQATWGNFVFTMFGLATTAAVTVGGLKVVNDKVDEVKQQTNGRLTAMDDEVQRLRRVALDNGLDPDTGEPIATAVQPIVEPDPEP
ncbi:hypothetical protein GCM10009846_10200 [Agrococcus versicolor]|uniref:Holin n=1 Tax=Agrococcus versicolor TaxID=501482 RepID=A0ABP5MCQ9_9MICO